MPTQLVASDALNYSKKAFSMPQYKARKLTAMVGNPPTLSATAESQSVFELPSSNVFNFSQSTLEFDLSITACAKNSYNWVATRGATAIRALKIDTEKGINLLDIQNLQPYQKLVKQYLTKSMDWKNKSQFASDLLHPVPNATDVIMQVTDGKTPDTIRLPYWSARELFVGAKEAGAAESTVLLEFAIPLGQLCPHSILSCKQDLFFGEKLTVTITWASVGDYSWSSTDAANDPTSGIAITTGGRIANLNLKLAIQSNEEVASEIKNQVMSKGLQINFLTPLESKDNTGTQTAYSYTHKLNISKGKSLVRVYHSLWQHGAGANSIKYQNHNGYVGGDIYNTSRVALNSRYESDFAEDYTEYYATRQQFLYGAVISTLHQYATNPCVIQDYSGMNRVYDLSDNESAECGLSLAEPLEVLIEYAKNATPRTYLGFAICQRVLNLGQSGASVSV